MKIGAIILAAGASTRFGEPKQLAEFRGQTLLRRAVAAALISVCEPVVVALGANYEQTSEEIKNLPVHVCYNAEWQIGLSASVKSGLESLLNVEPNISAAIITLADQPFVGAAQINSFAEKFYQSKAPIIAAEYNQTVGVPALFAKELFDELVKLEGDQGAKMLMKSHQDSLIKIALPEAAFDIDTKEDFESLLSDSSQNKPPSQN